MYAVKVAKTEGGRNNTKALFRFQLANSSQSITDPTAFILQTWSHKTNDNLEEHG